jgi:transcriptional regulator with XRE-family HTH domain
MSLQQVMEQQGRRRDWLASQTGYSPSYVTRVLNGERTPSPVFRAKASKALGVAELELFPAEVNRAA